MYQCNGYYLIMQTWFWRTQIKKIEKKVSQHNKSGSTDKLTASDDILVLERHAYKLISFGKLTSKKYKLSITKNMNQDCNRIVCTDVKRRVEQYKLYCINIKFSAFATLQGPYCNCSIICTLEMRILMTGVTVGNSLL